MTDASDERPGEGAAPNRRSVLQTAETDGAVDSSRRGVIAGTVASVAAALGFGGTAAAGTGRGRAARRRRVEQRYSAESVALETLQDRGADVLGLLVEEGHLDRGDVAELGTPEVSAIETQGAFTGHVAARTGLEEGELTVVVEPEADRRYAVLDHDDRDGATVFDPDSDDEVKPTCDTGYDCPEGGCTCPEYKVTSCQPGECYVNGRTGRDCVGCDMCVTPLC